MSCPPWGPVLWPCCNVPLPRQIPAWNFGSGCGISVAVMHQHAMCETLESLLHPSLSARLSHTLLCPIPPSVPLNGPDQKGSNLGKIFLVAHLLFGCGLLLGPVLPSAAKTHHSRRLLLAVMHLAQVAAAAAAAHGDAVPAPGSGRRGEGGSSGIAAAPRGCACAARRSSDNRPTKEPRNVHGSFDFRDDDGFLSSDCASF